MTHNPEKDPKGSLTGKFNETFNKIQKNEKLGAVYQYAQNNTRDTIAYVVLIVGILMFFFSGLYGGILVGLVVGVYFFDEIMAGISSINNTIEEQGMVRSLILGGILLTFLIAAPFVYVGAAIAVGVKYFIGQHTG